MSRIRASVPASLAAAMGSLVLAGQASGQCSLQLAAELEARVLPSGTVIVPAKVAGQDVWLFLGSNGAFPLVYESAANQLGLEHKPITDRTQLGSRTRRMESGLTGANGPLEQKVSLPSFLLGKVSLGAWQAVLLPGADRPLVHIDGHPVIGIMGTQIFRLVDTELDLANQRMRLFKATQCTEAPVYWGGEYTETRMLFDRVGAMHFVMELDGRRIDTGLLSGISTPSIDEGIARRYFGFDSQSPGVIREAGNGKEQSSYYAMSLTAAGLNVSNARVRISDSRTTRCGSTMAGDAGESIQYSKCENTVPFTLGTGLLQKLRIYISAKQEKIYFTRSTPAAAPTPPP